MGPHSAHWTTRKHGKLNAGLPSDKPTVAWHAFCKGCCQHALFTVCGPTGATAGDRQLGDGTGLRAFPWPTERPTHAIVLLNAAPGFILHDILLPCT